MAKERRDSKNRILEKGEYQKPDGRYMYRYTDSFGNTQFVYSWRLTKADRNPKGKHSDTCLRDLEKEIKKKISDGIDCSISKSASVNDYFELYMSQKKRLKPTTRANYRYKYDKYVRDTIGSKKISDIKYSDIKRFYNGLLESDGGMTATMLTIDTILNPVFRMAERDNCIRKNPVTGVATEIKNEVQYEYAHKKALTNSEQEALLSYIKGHECFKKWLNVIIFLLGTGCRIGEASGLTWDDCDMENNLLHIRRSLNYTPDERTRKYGWSVTTPKTKSGNREIPMLPEVREVLRQEKMRQLRDGVCGIEVDGVSGFVFTNRDGGILMARGFSAAVDRIVDGYNANELTLSKQEGRQPSFLPKITPHIFRHTFCTRLCENKVDAKVVQEVMGHADIVTTMNIYNTATTEFKKNEFEEIERKYKIM